MEKIITKSFSRLLDKAIHRGFATYDELAKSLGKRHYSRENIEKALDFYGDSDDVVVLVSSSGNSMNMVNAAEKAKKSGMPLITFSGFNKDNELRKYGKVNFYVNSENYNYVEIAHYIILMSIADIFAEKILL